MRSPERSMYPDSEIADRKRELLENLCLFMLKTSIPTHDYIRLGRRQTLQTEIESIREVWQEQIAQLKYSA